MLTKKDKWKKVSLLTVSIQIQKSRREKCEASSYQYTRLLDEIGSEMSLVLDMQELSRRKLARNLHDGLTQTVASLAMRVNFTRRLMETDPDQAKAELLKVEKLTRQTAKDIRHMIFILRRVDIGSQGLKAVLELMVDKLRELLNLEIFLSIEFDLVERFNQYKKQIIYSLIEESNAQVNESQQMESLWNYARLVSGTVKTESAEGKVKRIQILIPLQALTTQGTLKG
jgi:signal transduction histidine kinase